MVGVCVVASARLRSPRPCHLAVSAHATVATFGRPARGLCLRTTTTACCGHLMRPLLHAATGSRLWQTRERPPLDATARTTGPAHDLGRRQRCCLLGLEEVLSIYKREQRV
ncbi:hypothetical protein B296_00040570 [Ensete ventricosum]|uniref:Uncharacterized protein n=1 Tax=Ensete ventricosum TaxID=4639 RepID=A0A426YB05_ENSVE|nr:hypothetical protein B296_00040570 [Ensete ventricosum]